MKALIIENYGGPEEFKMGEVPKPEVGEHDVLIEIYATSVNPVDWKLRAGVFKERMPLDFPITIGHDAAGVVSEVGAKVAKWKKGDRVVAKNKGFNCFAEYVAIDESLIVALPDKIAFTEAASIPTTGIMAWKSLFVAGNLQKGQKVLIHGGAGGVGSLAIQLAKNAGAYVAATGSAANLEFMKSLGADEVIDYERQDFSKELREFDLVLDLIGGETQKKSWQVLKPGGVLLAAGPIPEADKVAGIRAEIVIGAADPASLKQIVKNMENGKLKAIITEVLPFEEKVLQEANRKVQTGHGRGKMVVQLKKEA